MCRAARNLKFKFQGCHQLVAAAHPSRSTGPMAMPMAMFPQAGTTPVLLLAALLCLTERSHRGVAAVGLARAADLNSAAAHLRLLDLSAPQGPCDILGAAGNPCVAAHSTVRALYAAYAGPLYTVFHQQRNKSADIHVLKPGGFADVAQHEAICPAEGECVISRVMDQSGNSNHLTPRDDRGVPHHQHKDPEAPPKFGHLHNPVDASKHKIHVGDGNAQVYGMFFEPGMGYKNNRTRKVPTGDETETMYAVMSGKRWGSECCFDYGAWWMLCCWLTFVPSRSSDSVNCVIR